MKLSCRVCSRNELIEMINLGNQPIAHRLLSTPEDKEIKYPFVVHFCQSCGLVQICDPIDPQELYLDYNYCFSSWKAEPHASDEIETIFRYIQGKSVFEIGCNDGKFLELLRNKGISTLAALEPNPFASRLAKEKGFYVYSEMLNESLCKEIVDKFGRFEIVVAREVLEHILDIHTFFRCVNILLSDNGFLFIDTPDIEIGLSMGDCSILWEEHPSYFTESVAHNTLLRFGFQPLSISKYNFSGGFLSILAKPVPEPITNYHKDVELSRFVEEFNQKSKKYGDYLRGTLAKCHQKKYTVILYGVGNRACTIVNALGLGNYIDFAIDDQQERQNKYMSGSRLPIYSPQVVRNSSSPIVCLLGVNQENEDTVKSKLKAILNREVEFVSLFSSNNIWLEVERLNNHLSSHESK